MKTRTPIENHFRYEIGGNLVPISDPWPFQFPLPIEIDVGSFVDEISFGQDGGINLKVVSRWFEADEDVRLEWWLELAVHPFTCCIEVSGWPALLDALARYTPIVNMDATDSIKAVVDRYDKPER